MAEAAPEEVPVEHTPDGGVVVDLTHGDLAQPLEYNEDDPNLCEAFMASDEGRKALGEIAATVIKRFDADFEASSLYRQRMADDLHLFFGDLPPKEYPYQNAPNAHVPILLENTIRLAFRTESEVFGDWTNFMGVMPLGPQDKDAAQALTLHANWQFREKLTDFPREMARAILLFYIAGDVTAHTYWDPLRNVNVTETLTPDEFVTPYAYKTTRPDYSDLPHYTKILRKYPHELRQMADFWCGVEDVIAMKPPSYDQEPDDVMRRARAMAEGIDTPTINDGAPYKLLWHEGWFDLPNQTKQRFCQVIMDHGSKTVLSLAIQEEVNWQEKARFRKQTAEKQQFTAALGMHAQAQQLVQQHQAAVNDLAAQGQMGSLQHQAAQSALAQAQASIPPPPPMPPWMKTPFDRPKDMRKDPIYMFTHGVCIEPLTGNLGLSFGRILADLNRAGDTAFSIFIDAAVLNNTKSFITTELVEADSPLEIKPGSINKLQGVPPGQLEGNIMPLEFQPANQQLLEVVQLVQEWGSASASSPDILSGAPGKSGETARGWEGRYQQAIAQISVSARHFVMSFLKNVLINNARLNAIYLDDEEWFQVQNHQTGQDEFKNVGRAMYDRDYRVSITADLKFSSQAQRIAEADELVQLPKALPPLQQNLAFQFATLTESLRLRGRSDLIQFLGQQPPPVPPMYGMPSPVPMPQPPPGAPGAPPGGPPQGGPPQGGPPHQGPPPNGPQPGAQA